MIHACTLLVLMTTCGPYASQMPLAALSGVLMLVAWNMSERKEVMNILKGPVGDRIVLVITYLFTVCIDLTVALQIGIAITACSL